MRSILLLKKLLGLVEMTSGLVNAYVSFSLPKWQAVKMIFVTPCVLFLAVVDAISKEEEDERHLQELEERFLQKRKSSPAFRYKN